MYYVFLCIMYLFMIYYVFFSITKQNIQYQGYEIYNFLTKTIKWVDPAKYEIKSFDPGQKKIRPRDANLKINFIYSVSQI